MNKKLTPSLIAIGLALTACGGGSDGGSASDTDQICRIAQRLVDDQVDGDEDGIERQLDRLAEIEGIDELTDLRDLEDLAAESGEDAALDLADRLDDDLDCEIDVPEIAAPPETTAPVETDPPATDPPVTEPPATDPAITEPPATDPPSTDAPVDTTASTPAEPGESLAVVEIGATGPGIDRPELAQSPADAVSESGISVLPIPAGDAISIEYSVNYDIDTFADEQAYSSNESITFTAATSMTIDEVRMAFVEAIIGSYDMEFSATDSTSSRDEVTQTATSLSPDRSREGVPRYEVIVATSADVPGVVIIEVSAGDYRDGALPGFIPAAAAVLNTPAGIGADLGWTLETWSWAPGFNQFNGNATTSGGLDWAIGPGVATDVAAKADEVLERVATPTFEDISEDREFYIVSDSENWSIRYSDVYEDAELRAGYNYSAF